MPSTERFWHTTKSAFLATEGCGTVGFEKSMRTVTIFGARIKLGAHIDDFVIARANQQYLTLSVHAIGTLVKAPMRGLYNTTCVVMHDVDKGTTYLS